MVNVVEFVSFKLKEGIPERQFLEASDVLNKVFLSVQKGYISRKLLKTEDTWADIVLWESMDDAMNAMKAAEKTNPADIKYFLYIEESSCNMQHWSVEKSY